MGISNQTTAAKKLYGSTESGQSIAKTVDNISPYLVAGNNMAITKCSNPLSHDLHVMDYGNKPTDGGHLLLSSNELEQLSLTAKQQQTFIRYFVGSSEFIRGNTRYCLWITDKGLPEAQGTPSIAKRIEAVREMRLASRDKGANKMAARSHQFREMNAANETTIIVPSVSSESREYLPCGFLPKGTIVSNLAFALYDAPLWNMALIASKLHIVWVRTVCGQLETRLRYSNTMGWNTFPIPKLTEKNKLDLTRCAEEIILARENLFPATIAEMYDPDNMPGSLRLAHQRNDEVLERIYIGRNFKNDTERLEKLFDLYTQMTAKGSSKYTKKANTHGA